MNKLLLIISSALLISACTGEPQKQDPMHYLMVLCNP